MDEPQYNSLLDLVSKGIQNKPKRGESAYLGGPGKEVFQAIQLSDDAQLSGLGVCIGRVLPKEPPSPSVHLSAFFRYVYGCFDKQGVLRSVQQAERIILEKRDWSRSDLLVDHVINYCKSVGNTYGEVVCCEMKAHRLGDLAIIHNDLAILEKMLFMYNHVARLAVSVKAKKNCFSSYYWALRYVVAMKRPGSEIIVWAEKFFDMVEQYCNKSTAEGKVTSALNCVYSVCSKKQWRIFRRKFALYKNPIIQAVNNSPKLHKGAHINFRTYGS